MLRIICTAILLTALGGCASLGYYAQAVGGQLSVLNRARPIDDWLDDPAATPELKARLVHVQAMREFASRELALPDNNSYRRYADLGRPSAMWNLFATPELSLKARIWCPLFAGCMSYHSYFMRERAEAEAMQLRAEGEDVHIGGVVAYSTAGWFADPVFNTMLAYSDPELAGILFHELAHQLVYVHDDTAFNESFATTVEYEGARRWLAAQQAAGDYRAYRQRARRQEQFSALLLRYRARLESLYASSTDDERKRAGKRELFDAMRGDYRELKKSWNDYGGYDRWMETLNNAKFVSVGLYHGLVPAFETLLARERGDLPSFYRAAQALARLPKTERDAALAEVLASHINRISELTLPLPPGEGGVRDGVERGTRSQYLQTSSLAPYPLPEREGGSRSANAGWYGLEGVICSLMRFI